MKFFIISLKQFLAYFLSSSLFIRVFIIYGFIVSIIIYYFRPIDALSFLEFLKIGLPSIYVIPAIYITLSNIKFSHCFSNMNHINHFKSPTLLLAHILATLIISFIISLPFNTNDYFLLITNHYTIEKLFFEFIKFNNILLFFILYAFSFLITVNDDEISTHEISFNLFALNFSLTFFLVLIDMLLNKILFVEYFGGYFGSHIFAKLSLAGLSRDELVQIPLISPIPNDVLLTIIYALISTMLLINLLKNWNKKYLEKVLKLTENDKFI